MKSEDFDLLLRTIYKDDPWFIKFKEVFDKFHEKPGLKINGKRRHIAKRKIDLFNLNISEKFSKSYWPFFECLVIIDFNHKDCFKTMQVMRKKCLEKNKPYLHCRKQYLIKQTNIPRPTFNRVIRELKEKNMLLLRREEEEGGFVFTPILAPLSWNVSEKEREKIEREVRRDIDRLESIWIQENTE